MGCALRGKSLEVKFHVLMEHFVFREQIGKVVQFRLRRELPPDQQISGFHKCGFFRQLFYGDAAVAEDALLSVDERNAADARTGVSITFIEGDISGLAAKVGNIDRRFLLGSYNDREFVLFFRPVPVLPR